MSLRDYHILISHSWDYSDDYRTIKVVWASRPVKVPA